MYEIETESTGVPTAEPTAETGENSTTESIEVQTLERIETSINGIYATNIGMILFIGIAVGAMLACEGLKRLWK